MELLHRLSGRQGGSGDGWSDRGLYTLATMDEKNVEVLATEVVRRIAAAKERLLADMAARGLKREDGWRIVEELRTTVGGTQFVFRPVHLRKDSPDLEATVVIDTSGRAI